MPPSSLSNQRRSGLGHSSTVGPGALMGSANYHGRIRFHDGSPSWLFRVPGIASFAVGLPSSLVVYLILSEYATLTFLETTDRSTSNSSIQLRYWRQLHPHGRTTREPMDRPRSWRYALLPNLFRYGRNQSPTNRHITIQASIFNPS
ncbi:hypothetical protein V499_01168 [Pseudogymnoascus sp. VKM F-103]|uniref:Uncharacterized protein n=1 Tax=Pseudogymnoascus verrucosus TaxID=342668 RepID=A0A1B8GBB5_9PEZI|nr:uncharacterized protein VE01_09245 [Pseudogymnoascus verrucosus]KFY79910.1 hypothetical protein V499_01168 [Pseudogymnoascus sp. VKM F-103]OBT93128.1 hypothetical protein VE01_09245 [Pseudogymnoascus verrucosus]